MHAREQLCAHAPRAGDHCRRSVYRTVRGTNNFLHLRPGDQPPMHNPPPHAVHHFPNNSPHPNSAPQQRPKARYRPHPPMPRLWRAQTHTSLAGRPHTSSTSTPARQPHLPSPQPPDTTHEPQACTGLGTGDRCTGNLPIHHAHALMDPRKREHADLRFPTIHTSTCLNS